jgi:23S rRNA (uracil1939-C5)-methyltransferase
MRDPNESTAATGAVIELRIDALAAGGDGIGRAPDGRAVFVPRSAPGDRVRVRLDVVRPRFARGELLELLEPGAARVEPRCAAFGECGGCSWQHVDYAAQCEAKRAIVEDALRRVGHLALPGPVTLHPSPAAYGYRTRARVAVQAGEVGYRRRRSHALCAVRRCPVLSAPLEQGLAELADAKPAAPGDWEIAVGETGQRAVPLDAAGAEPADGPPILLDVDGRRLRVSPGVFFQANAGLQPALLDAVAAAAGHGALALEFHAGAGFLTLRLARAFGRVVAVESHAPAAADLRHNLAQAGADAVEVVCERAEHWLEREAGAGAAPNAVVLDPPRTGLAAGAAERLAALGAARIVYLSCDPATLARDLARLVAGGYALERVEAFDLFPQTPHVEALATLVRA